MDFTCINCGSPATHTVSDSIKNIFRMEQIFFQCGATQTSSFVDRWGASKVLHEGCTASKQEHFPARIDPLQQYTILRPQLLTNRYPDGYTSDCHNKFERSPL